MVLQQDLTLDPSLGNGKEISVTELNVSSHVQQVSKCMHSITIVRYSPEFDLCE